MSKEAVVLLSGGLDSATCAAIAKHRDSFQLRALTVSYGQRHKRELLCAEAVAKQLGCYEHVRLNIDLRAFGGSALTSDNVDVPKCRTLEEMGKDIPVTYVPGRNLILLSFAVAFAESRDIGDIFVGVNAIDYSGYPDCRPEFIDAFRHVARLATKRGVGGGSFLVWTPLIRMTKAEIIAEGLELGVDYAATHSCYDPTSIGEACGRCDSCVIRLNAFRQLGVRDPIRYVEGVDV